MDLDNENAGGPEMVLKAPVELCGNELKTEGEENSILAVDEGSIVPSKDYPGLHTLDPKVKEKWEEKESKMSPEFAYNKHNEFIFDDEDYFPSLRDSSDVAKFDANNPELLNQATLRALIVQLTSPEVVDYNLICDFFLTYRMFVDSEVVMNLLITRLIWSLQYLNSTNEPGIKIGKLVLLRVFVVLRHWILNYFIDDFASNTRLCDLFTFYVNRLTLESNLVNEDMFFEQKILHDLKTHWISLLNEFWSLGINIEAIDNVLAYPLPMTTDIRSSNKLTKSNTEGSIHTNPSYRRSAMLSLYDQKTQHKCLIFDDSNSNDTNPQLSVHNLLLQHQPSRTSLNVQLQELKQKKFSNADIKRKPEVTNVRHQINIKDSSLALKKTTKSPNPGVANGEFDALDGKENVEPKDSFAITLASTGFSTNGFIKLPSSKVLSILPPTPVKKMEIELANNLNASPTKNAHARDKRSDDSDNDFARKKSIKKLVEGWKRSFVAASNKPLPTSPDAQRQRSDSDYSTSIKDAIDIIHVNNDNDIDNDVNGRIDILSARTIDELEYLIRYYVYYDSSRSTIMEKDTDNLTDSDEFVDVEDIREWDNGNENLPASDHLAPGKLLKSHSRHELSEQGKDGESHDSGSSVLDINDISELNIRKIDNLVNTEEQTGFSNTFGPVEDKKILTNTSNLSFQNPASINWNDEGHLNLDDSESKANNTSNEFQLEDSGEGEDSNLDMDYDEESLFAHPPPCPLVLMHNNSSPSLQSSFSTPSNITQYNADITDLGIAVSPKPVRKDSVKRISFNETNLSANQRRTSTASRNSSKSVYRHDSKGSAKSYISYDSAFSVSGNLSGPTKYDNDTSGGDLKKKVGYSDLRRVAKRDEKQTLSLDYSRLGPLNESSVSRSTSIRKSVRFSTLCALIELPFNDMEEHNSNSHKSSAHANSASRDLLISKSSIFSVALVEPNLTNSLNAHHTRTSTGSTRSIAIPGINNHILKELAAIPDESLRHNDPIDFAFNKLEGIGANSTSSSEESNHQDSANEGIDPGATFKEDTQDILDQINNVHTEDMIDYPSEVANITQEPPLTPARDKRKIDVLKSPLTSTPNKLSAHYLSAFTHNSPSGLPSPRTILSGYNPSSDLLSVKSVVDNGSHVSFVLSYDSQSLAQHFTYIEKDLLQEIDWKDVIELNWNKNLTPLNSWLEIIVNEDYFEKNKGVNLMIARFNLMVNWVISEVLLTTAQSERINIISRLIHIAYNCFTLQNFSTTMQIILALTSSKMLALKETWKNLLPGDILMLKNLEELALPFKNFLNIRLAINQIQPSKGCIPFVGLYLSDLIFNAERPAFVKPKPNLAAKSEHEMSACGDSTLNSFADMDKMINFSRFRTSVHIVKSLSQCIEWSCNYNFEIKRELLSKCLYIKSLDEEEMNYCMLRINNSIA